MAASIFWQTIAKKVKSQLPKVVNGIKFKDGIEAVAEIQIHCRLITVCRFFCIAPALAAILGEQPDPWPCAWRSCAGGDRRPPANGSSEGIPRRRRQADIEPGIARYGIS